MCGSDSEDDRKLKQAEARALKKIKFSNSKSSTVQSSSFYNGPEKSLFSCLLTCLVLEPSFSFLEEQHGAEGGDRFSFEGKDSLQHQTSVSPVDSQVTSGARVQTVNPSQQSQTLNDKYFYNTLAPAAQFTDLFYLHEQYFEIQEKELTFSSCNVKG